MWHDPFFVDNPVRRIVRLDDSGDRRGSLLIALSRFPAMMSSSPVPSGQRRRPMRPRAGTGSDRAGAGAFPDRRDGVLVRRRLVSAQRLPVGRVAVNG